jgi:tetratricopeptide (TPR) repeat protein
MNADPLSDPLSERRRADALLAAGDCAAAIPLYRRLVESRPEEESHLLALAWALHDGGRHGEARDCFERLFRRELERKVFTGFAYDELVRLCRDQGDWEGLLSLCERAAAAWPEDPGVLRTLGEAYRSAGRPAEAVGVFQRLTALAPEAPEHWCALGNARLAGGDPAGAAGAYDRAVLCDPAAEARFMDRLAAAALAAGFPSLAQSAWERCLALRPDEVLYGMGLGEALLAGGQWDAGEEAFCRAAALRPAAAGDCWRRLGKLLLQAGLPERAAAALTRAVAAEPDDPRCRLALAAACAAAGRPEDAAAALKEVEEQLSGKAAKNTGQAP